MFLVFRQKEDSMNADTTNRFSRTGMALDIGLIAVALLFIFFPEYRNPQLKAAVWVLFMLQCGILTYISWKTGMLSKTPGQIYETLRQSGAPKRRRFESPALFLGFVASVISIWPQH